MIQIAIAFSFSAVAALMAVAAALQRAAGGLELALMAALGVAVVLAVHLLPALLRNQKRAIVWPVWSLAFACALWSHATFFSSSINDAARARFEVSGEAAALAQKRADIESELATIKARPISQIARQIALSKSPEMVEALRIELREAERAQALRESLRDSLSHANSHGESRVTPSLLPVTFDPLTQAFASVLGVPAQTIILTVSVATAALIELAGMLLWSAALKPSAIAPRAAFAVVPPSPQIQPQNEPQPAEPVEDLDQPDELANLRAAVADGRCPPTVSGIRLFVGCSQNKAAQLRKQLAS